MTVEVHTKVSFHPFVVPLGARYALPDVDPSDLPMIELEDLPVEVIDALAETWLGNLYASANKPSPWGMLK